MGYVASLKSKAEEIRPGRLDEPSRHSASTMAAIAATTAPEVDVAAQLRLCVEAVACQCIGDEQTYTKNLKKQGAAGNADAQRLLAACDWMLGVEAEIARAATTMRTLGRYNIAAVLEAIVALPSPAAIAGGHWHICNISGAVSAQTIAIPAPAQAPAAAVLHVDARFAFFARALWVAAHVRDLERNRAFAFAPPPSAASLQDHIHAFLADTDGETADAVAVYARCISYALASLRAASAHFAAEISEARARADPGPLSTPAPVPTPAAPRTARPPSA